MKSPATISSLFIVPACQRAKVKHLLSPAEKSFLDLIADIIVEDIVRTIEINDCHPELAEGLLTDLTTP